MATKRSATPLSELHYRLAWSTPEIAALLGVTDTDLRRKLEDADGNPTTVDATPPDGQVWVRYCGVRLPGRKNVNGYLTFLADEVRPILAAGGQTLHPSRVDR